MEEQIKERPPGTKYRSRNETEQCIVIILCTGIKYKTVINCWLPDILMAVMGMETAETRASETARETTWTLFGVWRAKVRK